MDIENVRLRSMHEVLVELSKHHEKIRYDNKSYGYSDLLKFNLKDWSICSNKLCIMRDGEIVVDYLEIGKTRYDLNKIKLITEEEIGGEKIYDRIDDLYEQYKYSVPNSRSDYEKNTFYAYRDTELSFEQVTMNMQRTEARYRLESFIIFVCKLGLLEWENYKHWYRISDKHKELFIKREWLRK